MPLRSAEPSYRRRIVRGRERREAPLTGNEAGASVEQSSPIQRVSKMWLDDCLEIAVRIPDLPYIGCDVEWCLERQTMCVGHEDAELARDQFRAQIVRM